MRTITTQTTRQLATGIANQDARNADKTGKPSHTITATDEAVTEVKEGLDKAAKILGFDTSALRSTESAVLVDRYLDRRAALA
jgi:hypothetical protein